MPEFKAGDIAAPVKWLNDGRLPKGFKAEIKPQTRGGTTSHNASGSPDRLRPTTLPRGQAVTPKLLRDIIADAVDRHYVPPAPKPRKKKDDIGGGGKNIKKGVKQGLRGLDDLTDALMDIFQDPNKLSMGLTFDEDAYKRAKPVLQQAWDRPAVPPRTSPTACGC